MEKNHPTIREIGGALEAWARPSWAESYDNVGLQVGDPGRRVRGAVVALECTPAVLREAERREAQLIVTHHPLLFHPVRRVTPESMVSGIALRLAEARIALFSVHTNLDAAPGGVSTTLANRLGLRNVRLLTKREDAPQAGMGAIGILPKAVPLKEFLQSVAERLPTLCLRYAGDAEAVVRTVAVCGGAGTGLTQEALDAGVDAFVTSDISYHRYSDVLDVDGNPRMALIDAGHYETELHVESLLQSWLAQRFPIVDWHRTTVRTSPVFTFVSRRS